MAEQRTKEKEVISGIEDWFGSNIDKFGAICIERCWNGVIVKPLSGGPIGTHEVLVFQNQDQFVDWFQGWFAKSSKGARV